MTIDEIHVYFGNWTKAMRGLDLSVNAYQNWLKNGYVPLSTQIKIQKKTKGKLKADVALTKEK